MEKRDLSYLETQTKELRATMANLADDGGYEEFLSIIRRPGFTSVAEIALIRGIVDSMLAQAKTVLTLQQALLSAASKVELNPQPLPP
jgi:hypothetical protein